MNNNKVLLLGNGINLLSKQYSWKNLMEDLIDDVNGVGKIKIEKKPFPLLYEELLLFGNSYKNISEECLKKSVRKKLSKLKYNMFHKKVFELGISDIITTNYDYNLEKSQNLNLKDGVKHFKTDERKYSLLRYREYTINKNLKNRIIRIWHIHGEENRWNSILLGYEQYSGYLQNIRNYIFEGVKYQNETFSPLISRLSGNKNKILKNENNIVFNNIWVDYFFTKDIYIVGLEYAFTEIHLWWILNYWARLKSDLKSKKDKKISINNNIYYIYRIKEINNNIDNDSELDRCIKKLEMYESGEINKKSKLDLLKNYGTILKGIKSKSWEEFYNEAFKFIRNN